MSEIGNLKMAMLLDLSEWREAPKWAGSQQLKQLKRIDLNAADWQDQLMACQVDLILLKTDTFRKILHRHQDPVWDRVRGPRLTGREKEILSLSADGKMIKEMAAMLKVSEKTIKTHLGNLYLKLGVRSRSEAIAWYYGNDLHQGT